MTHQKYTRWLLIQQAESHHVVVSFRTSGLPLCCQNVGALREASIKVGPASHGAGHYQTLVGPFKTQTNHVASQKSLPSFTRALFQGFLAGRGNLITSHASIFKGHAAFRLMKKGEVQGPMFAFLGLVCSNIGVKSGKEITEDEEQFQKLHEWIQQGLRVSEEISHQPNPSSAHEGLKLKDYEIGEKLGERSCNAAVYAARKAQQDKNQQKQLAVKMLFNYSTSSQTTTLRKEFSKEALVLSTQSMDASSGDLDQQYITLPSHPNILQVLHSFTDDMPSLPGSQASYPAALPAHYGGLGRNRTFFLVMPRLDCTLKSYVQANEMSIDPGTSILLFLQLLHGITHLTKHGVAHRDLKSDNLLLEHTTTGCPRLVICDFGCCLAERSLGLRLPLLTDETNRGGNAKLMAPEVIMAECGRHSSIDYSKADAWAAGAIAYEIFGHRNPFYYEGIENTTYKEDDLPPLERAPAVVQWVVKMLLRRNPRERISAAMAATIMQLFLTAPQWWWRDTRLVTRGDVTRWLLTSSVRCIAEGLAKQDNSDIWLKMRFYFLTTTTLGEVVKALSLLRVINHLNNGRDRNC